jgi:serine/threonine protein kinase
VSSAEHQPGEVIAGRCRIERRLGGGGRGGTYLAELSSTGQKVALERITLRPQQRTSELEAALEAEAHLLAGVDHPKVGRYVASFFDEGKTSFYLAELYVEGESLEERIYRGEPCTEGFLRRVADDLWGCSRSCIAASPRWCTASCTRAR